MMTEALPATSMSLDGKQMLIIVVSVICIILTALSAGARIYGRLVVLRKLFVEDVFMIFAIFGALGISAVCIAGASYGLGKHDVELEQTKHLSVVRQVPACATYLWIGCAALAKMSVLFFLHRLDSRKPMRWIVYSLMFLLIAQNLSLVFIFTSYCFPRSALWPGSATSSDGGHWKTSTIQWYLNINGLVVAVLDATIFATPLFMLQRLAIPKNRKYLVGAQFGLAVLPIVAGCLRCYFSWHITASSDALYDLVNPIVCGQAEIHLAILCGSSSSFNVLLKAWGWLPCNRPSISIGSLPTMPSPYPMDDKIEQIRWHNWHLSTQNLSTEMVMAMAHRSGLASKESVINANSPRDSPRIVLDKRRYTDASSLPRNSVLRTSRHLGSETSRLSRETYVSCSTRIISMSQRIQERQYRDSARRSRGSRLMLEHPAHRSGGAGSGRGSERRSRGSQLMFEHVATRSGDERSGNSLHFFIDKGHEGESGVSARAIVQFPSINERDADRDSRSSVFTDRMGGALAAKDLESGR